MHDAFVLYGFSYLLGGKALHVTAAVPTLAPICTYL